MNTVHHKIFSKKKNLIKSNQIKRDKILEKINFSKINFLLKKKMI